MSINETEYRLIRLTCQHIFVNRMIFYRGLVLDEHIASHAHGSRDRPIIRLCDTFNAGAGLRGDLAAKNDEFFGLGLQWAPCSGLALFLFSSAHGAEDIVNQINLSRMNS